jgi:hypothetical protein
MENWLLDHAGELMVFGWPIPLVMVYGLLSLILGQARCERFLLWLSPHMGKVLVGGAILLAVLWHHGVFPDRGFFARSGEHCGYYGRTVVCD